MNDDLTARARARARHYFLNTTTHDLFIEAAERIETLEAALRKIAACNDDAFAEDIARAALAPEQEKAGE